MQVLGTVLGKALRRSGGYAERLREAGRRAAAGEADLRLPGAAGAGGADWRARTWRVSSGLLGVDAEELEASILTLQRTTLTANTRARALEDELRTTSEQLGSAQTDIRALERTISALREEARQREAEVRQERAQYSGQVQDLEAQVLESERQLKLLGPMVDDLRDTLQKEAGEVTALKLKLVAETKDRFAAQEEAARLALLVDEMEQRAAEDTKTGEEERREMQDGIAGMKAALLAAETDLEKRDGELGVANRRIADLERELGANKQRLSEDSSEISTLNARIVSLEKALEAKGEELRSKEAAEAGMRRQVQDGEEAARRAAAEASQLRSAADEARARLSEKEAAAGQLEAQMRGITQEVRDKEAELAKWKADLEALQRTNREVGDAKAEEIAALERKVDAAERVKQEGIAAMTGELDEFRKSLEDRERRLLELEESIDRKLARARGEAFTMRYTSAAIPHPDKAQKGGEDAFFVAEDVNAFGVADGVGGWDQYGVDPAEYSRQLASYVGAGLKQRGEGACDTVEVLAESYDRIDVEGSSTICFGKIIGGELMVTNLGDSGLRVLRNRGGRLRVEWKTEPQSYVFNMPYQLSSEKEESTKPFEADVSTVRLQSNDIIIAGTDGLWDNLFDEELCAVVEQQLSSGASFKALAEAVANEAADHSADPDYPSPFMADAVEAGEVQLNLFEQMQKKVPTGGKLDDITVVACFVE